MPIAWLIVHALVAALATGLPLVACRQARRARAGLGVGLVLLGGQLALVRWPWLLAATGWSEVVFVSELFVPLALLLATCAALAQPPGRARARTAALGAPLVVAAGAATTLPVRPPDLTRLDRPERVKDGVVLQSAPSTCAPAAAATLLRALGVGADERGLATACLTRPDRGTSDLGLFRGVAHAAPGRRVRFAWPGGLDRLPAPCLVFTGLDPGRVDEPLRSVLRDACGWDEGVVHAVVFFGSDGGEVVIGDPRIGRERWPVEHFEALWTGQALLVEEVLR